MADQSEELAVQGGRRPVVALLVNTTLVLALLTGCYYTIPLRAPDASVPTLGRLAVSLLLLWAVTAVFRAHARRSRRVLGKALYEVQWLLSALYLLILTFALVYTAVARLDPGQFSGIHDRTNALYYSVTIVNTVGFGDIYAKGTLAQVLVTTQMLFNLIYLGTALRFLSGLATRGSSPR